MGNPTSRFNESGLGQDGSGNPGFRLISHSRPLRFQIPAPEMFVENAVSQEMGNPTNRFNESGSGQDGWGDPGFRPISHSRPLRFQIPAPEMFVENAVFQKMGNPTNRFNESGSGRVGSGWVGPGREINTPGYLLHTFYI